MLKANDRLQQQAEELQAQAEELQAQAEELATANEELRNNEQVLREREEQLRQRVEEVETLMEVARWPSGCLTTHNATTLPAIERLTPSMRLTGTRTSQPTSPWHDDSTATGGS